MKKLFLFLCFTCGLFAQPALNISTTQSNLRSSTVLNTQISLTNNVSITALQFTISIPNNFSGAAATIGSVATTANKQLLCGAIAQNPITETCLIFGLNTTPLGNGVIAAIQTNVWSTPVGSTSNIVKITNIVASDGTGTQVTLNQTSSFNITVLSNCDLNGDTIMDILDINLEANWILGLSVASPTFTADMNNDTQSNILDLSLLINNVLSQTCTALNY